MSSKDADGANKSNSGIWIQRGIIIGLVVLCIVLYAVVPVVHSFVDSVVAAFASGDFDTMREFVASYGVYAAIVSFFLMVAQSVAAPLPAFLITITNATLFGWWRGAILSWSSAMVGAAVCFWIARILGREAVEKLIGNSAIASVDDFFEKHGDMSVLIARLLPFVSFDFVSYFAGLTGMNFWSFWFWTGIGQMPATIVYSYVGGMLTGGARMLMIALLLLFALGAFAVLLRQVYVERNKRRAAKEKAAISESEASGEAVEALEAE